MKKRESFQTKKIKKSMLFAAVIMVALTVMLAGCSKGSDVEQKGSQPETEAQTITKDESLVIPVSDLSSTVQFYPVDVDGVSMEVLAVRDDEGNIRTAFNTCQICYSSGRGYYVQFGDKLVCQNCGNQFTVKQVEIETGGCNPWPIFSENKTVTDESISISYDYLTEASVIFSNWKVDYK